MKIVHKGYIFILNMDEHVNFCISVIFGAFFTGQILKNKMVNPDTLIITSVATIAIGTRILNDSAMIPICGVALGTLLVSSAN